MKSKSVYLIFFHHKDVFNNACIECTREEFIDECIKNELVSSKEELDKVKWVIFEDGYEWFPVIY